MNAKDNYVTIDPANAADVKRLTGILTSVMYDWPHPKELSLDLVAIALTRYAAGEGLTPPKPAEPTGLGAVVEDRWGHHFVMNAADGGRWWNVNEDQGCTWDHIAAVRVLSEGVQPDPWASYYDRDLTAEDLDALPVGSVVVGGDGEEATKRSGGRWTTTYARETFFYAALDYYGPIRLVSVGGDEQ